LVNSPKFDGMNSEDAKKVITDQKDYDEYVSIKAALLNNLYELYSYVQYDPRDIKIPKNDKARVVANVSAISR
jgi:hypothetical protein